jgi:hypothetical protein
LVFINSNPFFEMPRPISNKIIYIGGLVDQQKEHQLNGQKEELEEVKLREIFGEEIVKNLNAKKPSREK